MTDLHRVARRRLKRSLRAGDELAFSPVCVSGERVFSHTIRFERGRYRVHGADGTDLGAFATLAAAERAGAEGGAAVTPIGV